MPGQWLTGQVVSDLIRPKHWIAAASVAGALVLAAGGATAYAASNASSPHAAATPSATPKATPKPAAARRSLLSRADHATLEIRQGGTWVTVDLDRGNVTAASGSSITLSRPDGQSVTLQLSSSTKFRGKVATSASALKTGVRAVVISENGAARSVTEGAKPLPAGR
jgi:hypothetical protein